MTKFIIGIDVSKEKLDYYIDETRKGVFANTPKGISALISMISDNENALVLYEATGRYHVALERGLANARIEILRVNGYRMRNFARSLGIKHKNDRIDAKMLAKFGACNESERTIVPAECYQQLNELICYYDSLKADHTAIMNRHQSALHRDIKIAEEERLMVLDATIQSIWSAIMSIISEHPKLKRHYELLLSIYGVGEVCAVTVIAMLSDLGAYTQAQITKLVGLAPFEQQSGNYRSAPHIGGGIKLVRKSLYYPAWSAIKGNSQLKALYDRLRASKGSAKLAIVAVMRKLLLIINAVIRQDRPYVKRP